MDRISKGNSKRTNAVKNVVDCDDREFPSAVADAVKIAGAEATSKAMILRAFDQMLAKLDNPDSI